MTRWSGTVPGLVTATGDPHGLWEQREHSGGFELVVPHTRLDTTAKAVKGAAAFAAGLNVTLRLVAVYVAPYPTDLRCPAGVEKHLLARLTTIAEQTSLPASIQLVVSRDRNEAFRFILCPGSLVLLGTRKRLWRTREQKLARDLTCQGHHVSLIHFD